MHKVRGADAAMEVVGSPAKLELAIDLIRPGGTLSSVGVHTATHFPFRQAKHMTKISPTRVADARLVTTQKNYCRKAWCNITR